MSDHNEKHIANLVHAVERLVNNAVHGAGNTVAPLRKTAFERFPLLFTLLGAFGATAVFYGFNGILNKISVVADNPFLVLLLGLLVLGATGTLYKRLS